MFFYLFNSAEFSEARRDFREAKGDFREAKGDFRKATRDSELLLHVLLHPDLLLHPEAKHLSTREACE